MKYGCRLALLEHHEVVITWMGATPHLWFWVQIVCSVKMQICFCTSTFLSQSRKVPVNPKRCFLWEQRFLCFPHFQLVLKALRRPLLLALSTHSCPQFLALLGPMWLICIKARNLVLFQIRFTSLKFIKCPSSRSALRGRCTWGALGRDRVWQCSLSV